MAKSQAAPHQVTKPKVQPPTNKNYRRKRPGLLRGGQDQPCSTTPSLTTSLSGDLTKPADALTTPAGATGKQDDAPASGTVESTNVEAASNGADAASNDASSKSNEEAVTSEPAAQDSVSAGVEDASRARWFYGRIHRLAELVHDVRELAIHDLSETAGQERLFRNILTRSFNLKLKDRTDDLEDDLLFAERRMVELQQENAALASRVRKFETWRAKVFASGRGSAEQLRWA